VIDRVRVWLRALFRRDDVDREMHDEMCAHLDRAAERWMARGMCAADARVAAEGEFGNVAALQEESRDARGVRWIEDAVQDVRFGLRSLIKTPAFTIVAIVSLILGIGVNTAMFTMLKVALRPGTIDEPETFIYVPGRWSKPAYDELRRGASALSAVFARSTETVLLAGRSAGEDPLRATADLVSENFFSAMHASIAIGRGFGPDDVRTPGGEPVAVLNQRFWKSHFGGDTNVVGQTFRLATGATYTIVGIAGQDFTGVRRGGPDFWVPYTVRTSLAAVYQLDPGGANWLTDARVGWLEVYGRLAPGHGAGDVRAQIELTLRRLAAVDSAFAPGMPDQPLRVETAEGGGINSRSEWLAASAILGATLIVLLVACFNVASLMLARATDRRREIAVRMCLGAGRERIIRQLLTESAIVAAIGALAAVAISGWTLRIVAASGGLAAIAADEPDRLARMLTPDGWVLAFAVVLSVASVLVCGLAPALRATRTDLAHAAKSDAAAFGVPRSRLRSALVVGQVALSLVLLVSAGVLLRSLVRALALDTGFDRAHLVTVASSLRLSGYDSARAATFMRTLEHRLATQPGVRAVGRGDLPLVQRARITITRPASGESTARAYDGYFNGVSASYFAATGIPILRGRNFSDDEVRARMPVVIVSDATARALWGSEDPLGKTLKTSPGGKVTRSAASLAFPSARVIGVARDAQLVELGQVPSVYVFLPSPDGELLLRTFGSTGAMPSAVRELARAIDPNAFLSVAAIEELISTRTTVSVAEAAAVFAGIIGGLALALAIVGVFGLMAYSVAQRTRELGIRRALGARTVDIARLILGDGLRIVGVGLMIGVAMGAVATRLLSSLLFGMNPLDVVAYAGVALAMGFAALLACLIPAQRATRADPLVALKAE
jgi:macrolide transport system ATP-binding/permease protein